MPSEVTKKCGCGLQPEDSNECRSGNIDGFKLYRKKGTRADLCNSIPRHQELSDAL